MATIDNNNERLPDIPVNVVRTEPGKKGISQTVRKATLWVGGAIAAIGLWYTANDRYEQGQQIIEKVSSARDGLQEGLDAFLKMQGKIPLTESQARNLQIVEQAIEHLAQVEQYPLTITTDVIVRPAELDQDVFDIRARGGQALHDMRDDVATAKKAAGEEGNVEDTAKLRAAEQGN